MKRIEPDGTAHERDGRSALRARRERTADHDDQTSNNDSTKPSSRSMSDVRGILQQTSENTTTAESLFRDEDTPIVAIVGSSSRAAVATDLLVCAHCTFRSEKSSSSATTSPSLFCELCHHPLQHEQRGTPPTVPLKMHQQLAQESMKRSGYSRSADRIVLNEEPRPSPKSTPEITAADFTPTDDDEMGVKCPTCTVFIPNATDKTRCSVCDTALASSDTAGSTSDVEIGTARECIACTLLNAPGASVCSACETPRSDDGDFSAGDLVDSAVGGDTYTRGFVLGMGYRQNTRDRLATASELNSRTAEEGGDTHAFTAGLIPRLHERLTSQYRSGDGRQRERRKGKLGRGMATPSAKSPLRIPPRGGRGALNWLFASGETAAQGRSGGGRNAQDGNLARASGGGMGRIGAGRAEWKLCDPRAAHCSQRGAPGSGYSCGYRNIQMVCSTLIEIPEYRRVLFGGSGCIPGILLLQCWLERAWSDGYDPEGCEQLGGPGALVGSEKWIGATECATLLRSFGLKAEVIDFETEASISARSKRKTRDIASTPKSRQQNEGTTPIDERLSPTSTAPARATGYNRGRQNSLLSYWAVKPEAQAIGSTGNGGITTTSSSSGGGGNGNWSVSNVDISRDGSATGTIGDGEEPGDSQLQLRCEREPSRPDDNSPNGRGASPSSEKDRPGIPSRGLSGGGGSGHLAPRKNDPDAGVIAARGGPRDRGGRRGRRGNERGRCTGRDQNIVVGNGCGQAVAEWAWEYFCTPWEVKQTPTSGESGGSCAARSRSEEAHAILGEVSDVDEMPKAASRPQDGVSAPERRHPSADCIDLTLENDSLFRAPAGGDRRGDSAGTVEQGTGNGVLPSSPAKKTPQLPPPLYLQHDGHSRTVVGVLWPGGRVSAVRGVGDDGADGGSRNSGGGKQLGTLLVFDPSHEGRELRDALGNEENLSWCSLLKRGAQSLRRQQFQMVAVRPGLVKIEEADSWKKIVSTKIRVG